MQKPHHGVLSAPTQNSPSLSYAFSFLKLLIRALSSYIAPLTQLIYHHSAPVRDIRFPRSFLLTKMPSRYSGKTTLKQILKQNHIYLFKTITI